MKEIGKLFVKEMLIIIVCAILGVAALAAVYLIPQGRMYENVKQSSIILHNEGLGRQVWESMKETMLDVYTDGLILNVTYTETGSGMRDVMLNTKVQVGDINPMESLYEVLAAANDDYVVENYGRYWHGYQVFLRPLLCLFTCAEIRQINMFLQLALVFFLIYILARSENRRLIIPFWGMYIFLSPISLFSSFQYSPCFYAMMAALIVLFALRDRLNDTARNCLFLLVGVMTAFFDLLTYPLISLAVPLIAYLASDHECMESVKKGVRDTFFYSVSWCLGYVGMWASKWIIASVLTEENLIADAIKELKFRSGHFDSDYKWFHVVKLNAGVFNIKTLIFALVCLGVLALGYLICRHNTIKAKMISGTWMILLVSCYPFMWYFAALNHSSNHSYFTCRELAISVFGLLTVGVVNIGRRAAADQDCRSDGLDNPT